MTPTPDSWYANTGGEQGIVYRQRDGKSIAVSYDKKDAPVLAAAPDLLQQLENTVSALESIWRQETIPPALLRVTIDEARYIIQKAKGQ